MFYSVPYQYIKEKVDVRITDIAVEVYSKNERIASHRRLTGRPGQYSTQIDHIFCSQFLDDGWYERIGSEDNPLSDSIMDRIKYDAYKISIKAIDAKHDKSMREVYGLKASESL